MPSRKKRALKTMSFYILRLVIFATIIGTVAMLLFYIQNLHYSISSAVSRLEMHQDNEYTINTPGCKIPKLDLWDSTLKRLIRPLPDLNCSRSGEELVKVEKTENGLTFRVNSKIVRKLYGGFVNCSLVPLKWKSDYSYFMGPAHYFTNELKLNTTTYEFVEIKCKRGDTKRTVYVDFRPFVIRKQNVEDRIRRLAFRHQSKVKRKFNIILLGVDSASKNQFLRHMRKTYTFMRQNLTFVELQGYNKLGKNTYPNMIPFLTGKLESELPDTTKEFADALPLIWRDFQDEGYRTLFSEDQPDFSIFNYGRAGFENEPTDYYLRPFSLAMEPHVDLNKTLWRNGCMNARSETSLILRWTEDFLEFFPDQPLIAFTFLTRLSHDDINQLSYVDKPVSDFLVRLHQRGHLNKNTIVFLFSDHGFRYGDVRWTYTGRMEGKLPFMFIIVPSWFPTEYPQLYNNLVINQRRLTTPLDIYATLKDLLDLDGGGSSADGTVRSISLLKRQVPIDRTCKAANIKTQWCSCVQEETISLSDPHVARCANAVISKLNHLTSRKRSLCAELSLQTVIDASQYPVHLGEDQAFDGATTFSVTLRTWPNNATFEGTVMYNGKRRYSVDNIERTDRYGNQSACIHDAVLKPYCYCKHWKKKKAFIEDVGP